MYDIQQIHGEIEKTVHERVSKGYRPPNLTVVLVGEDPPSQSYVNSKLQAAKKVGMKGEIIRKPDTITEVENHYHFVYCHIAFTIIVNEQNDYLSTK